LSVGSITAWEGLVDRMAVRAGQAVLVPGGAGGVGQMVIQIVRARGATVFATGRHPARKRSKVWEPASSTVQRPSRRS
jgi:NADPH:quinone reductase-like Zn-dependent oxidoreductase